MVEKTPIGWALVNQERRMLELCPEVRILADKVMPDHHHMVLHVQQTMTRSIKEVLRGYMQGCKAEARRLGVTENIYDGPPFYRVLTHKGQLHAMIEYVKANADRAWQRRQNPDLFRMHRQTEICGLPFTSMGNHFLLNWPDRQLVEMSRSADEQQIMERLESVLASAHNGAVTYSASISKGERMIARKIRELGFPLVVLMNEGFPAAGTPQERYYKPGGGCILKLVRRVSCCCWNRMRGLSLTLLLGRLRRRPCKGKLRQSISAIPGCQLILYGIGLWL